MALTWVKPTLISNIFLGYEQLKRTLEITLSYMFVSLHWCVAYPLFKKNRQIEGQDTICLLSSI